MNTLGLQGIMNMRRLVATLWLAVAAIAAVPALASAATLTVNDDALGTGPPGATCAAAAHTTIQAAIDDAALNDATADTILVCTGTYGTGVASDGIPAASVPATRPGLDLIGARAGQDARTRPSAPEALVTDPDGGIVVHANDITIDGFDVRDAQQNFFAGIWLESGTSNHRVINNIVRDNGEGLAFANGNAGQTVIRFNFFDANNEVFGNGISADLGPTQNVLIDRNLFRDHQNAGVIFQSTSTTTGFNQNVQIVNNQFVNTNPNDAFNENRIILLSTLHGTIQGNTFTNNVNNAIQLLGASQDIDIVGNSVIGAGFSAVRINNLGGWDPNSNVRVNGNNLFGTTNSGGDGAGIKIALDGYAGTLQAHFNRIAGNDRGIELNDSGESVDAENNWWGCNAGPAAPACDPIVSVGTVDSAPHLVLGLTASPSTVPTGGSSTVIASLAQNSVGATPGLNNFPADVPILFSATFGSVASPVATASPTATNLFQAGAFPGNGNVFAALDNQSVSTPVTVTTAALAQQAAGRCKNERVGGPDRDVFTGTAQGDRLRGRGGNDRLRGKGGDDCLNGETENDRLNGGSGEDLLKGGSGDDVLNAKDGEPDKVRCGLGEDKARVDAVDTVKACEHVS